jgi:hypothetical protein
MAINRINQTWPLKEAIQQKCWKAAQTALDNQLELAARFGPQWEDAARRLSSLDLEVCFQLAQRFSDRLAKAEQKEVK